MSALPLRTPLPASDEAPALARRLLYEQGSQWPALLLQDAQLLISELVTNAVRHGAPPVNLRISTDAEVVRVEVSDGNPRLPGSPRRMTVDGEGHRGLFLVATLAAHWGSYPRSGQPGKVVWFELVLSAG